MKKVFLFTVLFSVAAFVSCNKEDDIDFSSEIVGTWQFSGYQADVRTDNEIATKTIKTKLESRENIGANTMTFTADKKVLANSIEVGTYSIDRDKLTITEIDGDTNITQISISGNVFSVIEDKRVFYQFELPYFGFEKDSVVIHELMLTTKYKKV